jgi:hypothetical protein
LALLTHGLRPFDTLRAGCGLHSFAASRLTIAGRLETAERGSGITFIESLSGII